MLLPFMDQTPLYESINFNAPFDNNTLVNGNRNRTANDTLIVGLLCPSDPSARKWTARSAPSSYMLSAGPVANWARPNGPGPFSRYSSKRFRDFVDGTSNTILAAEGVVGNARNRSAPGFRNSTAGNIPGAVGTGHSSEYSNSTANLATLQTYYTNCYNGASSSAIGGQDDEANRWWASGAVFRGPWFNTLMPPNSGSDGSFKTVNCDNNTSVTDIKIKNASSYHTGGAHVLMTDGAVFFASDTIDHGVWVGAGSIDGEEDAGGLF
jgi:hypothetical protein